MLIEHGDLLESKADFIAHQCNCITTKSKGLSSLIFETFPYADIYSSRSKPDKLGTIIVCGNGQDQRFVINMLAQYYPGKPKYDLGKKPRSYPGQQPKYSRDSEERRLAAFQQCLDRIAEIPNISGKTVAFPYGIGCGLAGGNWEKYEKILSDWSCCVKEKERITVYVLKKV
jgi:O-acetyl-ADP-ribose deacetylase (regulator of RNase III)